MSVHPTNKFQLTRLTSYDNDSLIAELRRVAALVPGNKLLRSQFSLHAKVNASTVCRRFGGWKQFLTAAGLANRFESREWSRDEIVAALRRLQTQLGRSVITLRDIEKHAQLTLRPIRRHFGNLGAALEAAGCSAARNARRYTDDECFENLLAVWTALGRQPHYSQMEQPPSSVPPKAYVRRWGSWRAALAAFISRVNAEPAETTPDIVAPVGPVGLAQSPRRTGRDIPLGLRYKVLVRDRFRCVIDGRSPATHPGITLHIDHILAWSRGGETVLDNLRTLCSDCNLGKGATVEER